MDRQYDYRPRWLLIILCVLIGGVGALFMGSMAHTNDRGLNINLSIDLSFIGATIFYWVVAAVFIGLVVVAGFLAITRVTNHQRIRITAASITIPRSRWSREQVTVPFGEIVELSTSEVSGKRSLKIVYNGGKFTLMASMLPRMRDFDEICATVREGVEASRPSAD